MSNTCQAHNIIAADYYERIPKALQIIQEETILEFGHISVFGFLEVTLNLINQLSVLLTFLGISYTCIKLKFEKTAFHAFWCTLGLVFLLAEGMMVRYPSNLITYSLQPGTKDLIHISLMVSGGLLGIMGTVQKMRLKRVHFNTTHGKFGLASCIFWILNIALGIFAFISRKNSTKWVPLLAKIIHNFVGLLTLIMSCFCQYCGYKSGFFRRNFSNQGVYRKMIILILIFTALGPIKICVDNFLKFKKS